ncbi:hypothetical protein SAMN05421505_1111, partial [Sinosporangium album]
MREVVWGFCVERGIAFKCLARRALVK